MPIYNSLPRILIVCLHNQAIQVGDFDCLGIGFSPFRRWLRVAVAEAAGGASKKRDRDRGLILAIELKIALSPKSLKYEGDFQ